MPEDSKPEQKDAKEQSKKQEGKQEQKQTKQEIKNQETKELLQKSEISIWLDHYDDIFSDFDPRPYSQRAISDDFLKEAKKVTKEIKPGVFELRILAPANHRHEEHEGMIRKRLREHFKKHADQLRHETEKTRGWGATVTALGASLMLFAATAIYFHFNSFLWTLILVIMEPAGWFMVWNGLDFFFVKSKDNDSERIFYERMTHAEIKFDDY